MRRFVLLATLAAGAAQAQIVVRAVEDIMVFDPANGQLLNRFFRQELPSTNLPPAGLAFDRNSSSLLTNYNVSVFGNPLGDWYSRTLVNQVERDGAGLALVGSPGFFGDGPEFIKLIGTTPLHDGVFVDSIGRMVWTRITEPGSLLRFDNSGITDSGTEIANIAGRNFRSLSYDIRRDVLYGGDFDGSIYRIDLAAQTATLAGIGPSLKPLYSENDDKFYWIGAGNSLLVSDADDMFNTRLIGPLALPDFFNSPLLFGATFVNFTPVPEPGTVALMGFAGVAAVAWRRRKRASPVA
jgi:hypothetical protein